MAKRALKHNWYWIKSHQHTPHVRINWFPSHSFLSHFDFTTLDSFSPSVATFLMRPKGKEEVAWRLRLDDADDKRNSTSSRAYRKKKVKHKQKEQNHAQPCERKTRHGWVSCGKLRKCEILWDFWDENRNLLLKYLKRSLIEHKIKFISLSINKSAKNHQFHSTDWIFYVLERFSYTTHPNSITKVWN